MDRTALVEALADAPQRFEEVLASFGDDRLVLRPSATEWSAIEIFDHVRASDGILRPRVVQVLIRPGTPLPSVDERAWADVSARASIPLRRRLLVFAAERAELVGVLRSLSDEEWALAGEHEDRGRQTIEDIARHIVDHEREHLDQLVAG